ncbi:unnamed protein product [Protopolystoma xenopodis]|uniref:Uncharacterized protein n=1 Tax=Protopolystoma xenopodis TaxID=117903 RepID=A0A448WC55_9PLAT|nr:unnamed protein product [Protopolystoma xenopodis]
MSSRHSFLDACLTYPSSVCQALANVALASASTFNTNLNPNSACSIGNDCSTPSRFYPASSSLSITKALASTNHATSDLSTSTTFESSASQASGQTSGQRRFIAVACQDRRLRVYNISTGRQVRCFRASHSEEGVVLRCTTDPTGTLIARITDDLGQTSGNVSSLQSDSGNYRALYGLRTRYSQPGRSGLQFRPCLNWSHHYLQRYSDPDECDIERYLAFSEIHLCYVTKKHLCRDYMLDLPGSSTATGANATQARSKFHSTPAWMRIPYLEARPCEIQYKCSHKYLNLFYFSSGELLATMYGHSEPSVGLRFLPDLRHLVSVSSDSCIFVWRLSSCLSRLMMERHSVGLSGSTTAAALAAAGLRLRCSPLVPNLLPSTPTFAGAVSFTLPASNSSSLFGLQQVQPQSYNRNRTENILANRRQLSQSQVNISSTDTDSSAMQAASSHTSPASVSAPHFAQADTAENDDPNDFDGLEGDHYQTPQQTLPSRLT